MKIDDRTTEPRQKSKNFRFGRDKISGPMPKVWKGPKKLLLFLSKFYFEKSQSQMANTRVFFSVDISKRKKLANPFQIRDQGLEVTAWHE